MPTYDIAISFAGEDRLVADKLASLLTSQGLDVFYDEYVQADLWGKDLYTHLLKIYKDEAKYCLMIISEHYARKQWTNHERRAAQARAFAENIEYILPLRLDDTSVAGILDTVGYVDYWTTDIEKIIKMIVQKIQEYNKRHGITYEIVKVEDVFAKQQIRVKGKRNFKDSDMTTTCPACETVQRLSDASLSFADNETIYTCINGCQPIVIIGRPGIISWPGRGYRLGDHVIRNVSDIILKTKDMIVPMKLSARKAALMRAKPKD